MNQPRIVLTGQGQKLEGLHWESADSLRIGREPSNDVIIPDVSVERSQAEVKWQGSGWILRDLAGNERFPTILNNTRVTRGDHRVKVGDRIQCGKMFMVVSEVAGASAPPAPKTPPPADDPSSFVLEEADPFADTLQPATVPAASTERIKMSGTFVKVQASTNRSWDQALEVLAYNRDVHPQPGQAMLTLLRTNHHLSSLANLEELLNSILADAISSLGAQRGSIILFDPHFGQLEQRAVQGPKLPDSVKGFFSKTLADRCFRRGESLLCRDVNHDNDLVSACSIRAGAMTSIICALLRSPRKRIGVLQLDRGPFQEPFSETDLYLADAIAASVAVGIESAQLVDEQREQFVQTVTSLARAVEMRDQYTGDHTRRVTDYSMLLADELKLSPLERYQIQIGTPLHDIGKIGIDDAILRKPGKLTDGEFEFMKTHTLKGAAILESIYNLVPMIPIVRHHHERWDGSGYPDRLASDQIHITARIVAVADAFDAMTTQRPYRAAMPLDRAFQELHAQAGKHFDPNCVNAFLRVKAKVESTAKQK